MITQTELKKLFCYDQNTGLFTRLISISPRAKAGDVAGCISMHSGKNYIRIGIKGKLHRAHRLVWLYIHGKFPENDIDHINGDGTDNRLVNLRAVTRSENGQNARLHIDNNSGVSGVYWNKKNERWYAQIHVDKKKKHLGCFKHINDAVIARRMAEKKYNYHGNHGTIRPL